MNIAAESYGRAVILNLKGDFVEDTLVAVRQTVDHQLADKEVVDIVLNMEAVPFVDSACLEYLLDLQGRLDDVQRAGGLPARAGEVQRERVLADGQGHGDVLGRRRNASGV